MKGKVIYFMVNMSFRLRLSEPVSSVDCIFPDSFILSFSKMACRSDVEYAIEFDFKVYRYRANGNVIDCMAKGLDCKAFPYSASLVDLLKERRDESNMLLEWKDVNIYIARDEETGVKAELLAMTDVVLDKDGELFSLPAYYPTVVRGTVLSDAQLKQIHKIMWDATGFCTAHLWCDAGCIVKLFESSGTIYLRTIAGEGYYLNTNNGSIGMFGVNTKADQMERAREVIEGVIPKLSSIPFPVSSISIPYSGGSFGYYIPSKRESGAFDIVIE